MHLRRPTTVAAVITSVANVHYANVVLVGGSYYVYELLKGNPMAARLPAMTTDDHATR